MTAKLRVLMLRCAFSVLSLLLMPVLILISPVLLLRWYLQRRRAQKTR